jgi:hypothetical protein
MLDYQRITDDVRSALLNNGLDGEDFLQAAAADYSLAIDEINDRLRQCTVILRKGLRSEALRLCEIEPNLLEAATVLDFPERDSWAELLKMRGLIPPAGLLVDMAAELNEAYAIEQPLAALLGRHRLLAMSRGPLTLRLQTLRELAERDRENPVWEQDIRGFEEERLKEIRNETAQAIAAGDGTGLAGLAGELANSHWRQPPPESLLRQITAARTDLARTDALAELNRIEQRLGEAHAAMDLEAGRKLRQRWNELTGSWRTAITPELLDRAGPALDWLHEQDELAEQEARHAAAIAALDRAIAQRQPVQNLLGLHREAARGGDVPPEVEASYRKYLAARELAAKRRARWTIAALAIMALIVAGLAVVVLLQKRHEGQVVAAVQTLEDLLQEGKIAKLNEAQNYLDQLTAELPRVAGAAELQQLRERVQKLLEEERVRKESFRRELDRAVKSLEEKLPDREALASARRLVSQEFADETAAVSNLDAKFAEYDTEVQKNADANFTRKAKSIEDEIAKTEAQIGPKPDWCAEQLKTLDKKLSSLKEDARGVTPKVLNGIDMLQVRVKEDLDKIGRLGEKQRFEEQITTVCGDADQFRQKLLEYAQKYSEDRCSADLKRAADELPLWKWLAEWNEAVRSLGGRTMAEIDRKTAAEHVAKLRKLLAGRAGHPDVAALRRRLEYLEAVAARIDNEGPIEEPLKRLFADPLVAGAWMVVDANGQRYYVLEDLTEKLVGIRATSPNSNFSFEYVKGMDFSKKKKTLNVNGIKFSTAPQRAVAESVNRSLEDLKDENWDFTFYKIIQAISSDEKTEPLLKIVLLRKSLAVGSKGSRCFGDAAKPYLEALQGAGVRAAVNWLDPNRADEAATARSAAEAALAQFPEFKKACEAAGRDWQLVLGRMGTEYRWLGWLRKRDGKWECRLARSLSVGEGRLFVLTTTGTAGIGQNAVGFQPVGRMDRGGPSINADAGAALLEGRPVYEAFPPGN